MPIFFLLFRGRRFLSAIVLFGLALCPSEYVVWNEIPLLLRGLPNTDVSATCQNSICGIFQLVNDCSTVQIAWCRPEIKSHEDAALPNSSYLKVSS